jgi:hypothetical protein
LTQDGSFPGRPRGRRARHDNDGPEWSGYDADEQDQREFPDLAPIRPREARTRDGRTQGDWQRQQAGQGGQGGQPAQGGWQSGGGYLADGPGYPSGTTGYPPVGPGGPSGPGGPGGSGGSGGPGGTGPGGGQPWPLERQAPGQQTVNKQAMSQQGSSPQTQAQRPEEDIPDWAEPDSVEAFTARWRRRGLESRGDRRTDRRKHRRLLFGACGAVVVAIAVTVYFLTSGGSGSANLGFGSLVTTFLPGELQSVPNACDTVPNAMLTEFLPGTLKQASPPLNSGSDTQCTWTLDDAPTYRVLEVALVAYSPSALYGNGSATAIAEETFGSSEQGFVKPGAKSGEPTANVTELSGLPGGNDTSAFMATQVFNKNGAIMDVAHVLVRYRNVVVTVVMNGLDQANGKKKYGPVTMGDLSTAAKTVAKEVAGKIVG